MSMSKLRFLLLFGLISIFTLAGTTFGQGVPQWGITPEQWQAQYGNAERLSLYSRGEWYTYPVLQEQVFSWNQQSNQFEWQMQNISPITRESESIYRQQYTTITNHLNAAYGKGTPYMQNTTEGLIWYPPQSRAILSYDQYWFYRIQQYQGGGR